MREDNLGGGFRKKNAGAGYSEERIPQCRMNSPREEKAGLNVRDVGLFHQCFSVTFQTVSVGHPTLPPPTSKASSLSPFSSSFDIPVSTPTTYYYCRLHAAVMSRRNTRPVPRVMCCSCCWCTLERARSNLYLFVTAHTTMLLNCAARLKDLAAPESESLVSGFLQFILWDYIVEGPSTCLRCYTALHSYSSSPRRTGTPLNVSRTLDNGLPKEKYGVPNMKLW